MHFCAISYLLTDINYFSIQRTFMLFLVFSSVPEEHSKFCTIAELNQSETVNQSCTAFDRLAQVRYLLEPNQSTLAEFNISAL